MYKEEKCKKSMSTKHDGDTFQIDLDINQKLESIVN